MPYLNPGYAVKSPKELLKNNHSLVLGEALLFFIF